MADHIICPTPNCGYRGEANPIARGSTALLLFLLLFCFVPGVLYLLFRGGYDNHCPRCAAFCGRASSGPSSSTGPLLLFLFVLVCVGVAAAYLDDNNSNRPPGSYMSPPVPEATLPSPAARAQAPDAGAAQPARRRHRRRP